MVQVDCCWRLGCPKKTFFFKFLFKLLKNIPWKYPFVSFLCQKSPVQKSKFCNINFCIGNDTPPPSELFRKFIRFGRGMLPYWVTVFAKVNVYLRISNVYLWISIASSPPGQIGRIDPSGNQIVHLTRKSYTLKSYFFWVTLLSWSRCFTKAR